MKKIFQVVRTEWAGWRTVAAAGILVVSFTVSAGAATLYWFGTDTTEGGDGTWHTPVSNWSSTSVVKTPATTLPQLTDTAVFAGGAGTVTMSASPLNAGDMQVNTAGYIFRFGSGVINFNVNAFSGSQLSAATFDASTVSTGNFIVATGNNANFTGTVTDGPGTLSVRKGGGGRLELSGTTVNYSGNTIVTDGILAIGHVSRLGAGVLNISSLGPANTGVLEANGTITRPITNAPGAVQMSNASATGGFGAYGGNLYLNFGGGGTILWQATGITNILSATLVLATPTSTHTTFLQNNVSILGAAKNVLVDNGAAAIDAEFSGTVSGTHPLTKLGPGTLRMATNYNAGTLSVNAGTLLVDGTVSGTTPLTVANGATLGGDGTITRATTVAGTLMGGRGTGNQSLHINANVTFQTGSSLAFGLGPTSADTINRLGGTWDFSSFGNAVTFFDNGIQPQTYLLMTGLVSDPGVSSWTYSLPPQYYSSLFFQSGNVYLDLQIIPEPSTVLLLIGGGLVLAVHRRSRRWFA